MSFYFQAVFDGVSISRQAAEELWTLFRDGKWPTTKELGVVRDPDDLQSLLSYNYPTRWSEDGERLIFVDHDHRTDPGGYRYLDGDLEFWAVDMAPYLDQGSLVIYGEDGREWEFRFTDGTCTVLQCVEETCSCLGECHCEKQWTAWTP